MANPYAWSTALDQTNGNVDGDINWQEEQFPDTVNNSSRAQMGSHARFYLAVFGGLATTGGATSYALATSLINPATSLRDGLKFSFKAHIASGASPTLNIDATGAKKLYNPDLSEVGAGRIVVGQQYEVKYDSTLDGGAGGWVLFGTGLDPASAVAITAQWKFSAGIAYGANSEGQLVYSGTESQIKLAAAATGHVVDFDGTPASRTEPAGTGVTDGLTSLTVEKGDARYFQPSAFVGTVIWRASRNVPTGWLECNGQAVSRTTYAALFAEIGTTFGEGDASTTFNVPDLIGRFVRGHNPADTGLDPSRDFGSAQDDAFQGHQHGYQANNRTTGGSSGHALTVPGDGGGSTRNDVNADAGILNPIDDTVNGVPRTANETRPVNIALMPIIKT